MENLASKINLVATAILVVLASIMFFASVIGGYLLSSILTGCLLLIGIKMLKLTIDESA